MRHGADTATHGATARPAGLLVLRAGAVGDFVLTVPVLRALRAHWPGAWLTLAASPGAGALALACGLADAILSIDSADISRLYGPSAADISRRLTASLACDLAVCLLGDSGGRIRGNLLRAGARQVVTLDPAGVRGHAADYLASILMQVGIQPPLPAIPELRLTSLPAALTSFAATCPHPVVILHPGSGSPRKNWPATHFAVLARRIADELAFCPVAIFGEADDVARRAFAAAAPEVAHLPARTLAGLAAELSTARAFVGNDSGPTHLAAALGVPVVALFGPTDPAVWAPRGSQVRILSSAPYPSDLAALAVEQVFDAVVRLLAPISGQARGGARNVTSQNV